MRITNIDTLSALFDRLITERIKWFFFMKNSDLSSAEHQLQVIHKIKERINEAFQDVYEGTYTALKEKRTFNEDAVVEELEELITNDIHIGEADRIRLAEVTSNNPNLERIVVNEKRLRKANEGRARNKNTIDAVATEISEIIKTK